MICTSTTGLQFSFISNRYVRGVLNRLGIKGINKKGVALALNFNEVRGACGYVERK